MKIVKKEEKTYLQKINIDQENQYKERVLMQEAGNNNINREHLINRQDIDKIKTLYNIEGINCHVNDLISEDRNLLMNIY